MKALIISLILLTILASCNQKVIFSDTVEIDSSWSYADTLVFSFEVTDTIPAYDIHLTVDHKDDFGFGNLYVLVGTEFPDSRSVSNPVSLSLADNFGQWLGKCSNDWCSTTLVLSENIFFNKLGTYRILMNQHSRSNNLEGIRSAKLTVSKSDK